jgi:hypothetical protein
MNRKEAIRQTHQQNVLMSLGFTTDEAESLRRISMTLRRWHELECNGDVQQDEATGKWYAVIQRTGQLHYPVADRETGARKRLEKILEVRNKRIFDDIEGDVSAYVQTDPRGAALYILRPGDVPEGADVSSYYNRGICVY